MPPIVWGPVPALSRLHCVIEKWRSEICSPRPWPTRPRIHEPPFAVSYDPDAGASAICPVDRALVIRYRLRWNVIHVVPNPLLGRVPLSIEDTGGRTVIRRGVARNLGAFWFLLTRILLRLFQATPGFEAISWLAHPVDPFPAALKIDNASSTLCATPASAPARRHSARRACWSGVGFSLRRFTSISKWRPLIEP